MKHSEKVPIQTGFTSAATPYTARMTTVGWMQGPVTACRSLPFHVLTKADDWGHKHGRVVEWLLRPLCNYYDRSLQK